MAGLFAPQMANMQRMQGGGQGGPGAAGRVRSMTGGGLQAGPQGGTQYQKAPEQVQRYQTGQQVRPGVTAGQGNTLDRGSRAWRPQDHRTSAQVDTNADPHGQMSGRLRSGEFNSNPAVQQMLSGMGMTGGWNDEASRQAMMRGTQGEESRMAQLERQLGGGGGGGQMQPPGGGFQPRPMPPQGGGGPQDAMYRFGQPGGGMQQGMPQWQGPQGQMPQPRPMQPGGGGSATAYRPPSMNGGGLQAPAPGGGGQPNYQGMNTQQLLAQRPANMPANYDMNRIMGNGPVTMDLQAFDQDPWAIAVRRSTMSPEQLAQDEQHQARERANADAQIAASQAHNSGGMLRPYPGQSSMFGGFGGGGQQPIPGLGAGPGFYQQPQGGLQSRPMPPSGGGQAGMLQQPNQPSGGTDWDMVNQWNQQQGMAPPGQVQQQPAPPPQLGPLSTLMQQPPMGGMGNVPQLQGGLHNLVGNFKTPAGYEGQTPWEMMQSYQQGGQPQQLSSVRPQMMGQMQQQFQKQPNWWEQSTPSGF